MNKPGAVGQYGRIYSYPDGTKVRSDRPLDGAVGAIPSFICYGCGQQFFGDPPMLIVRYPAAELRFCTDNCALEEGFAVAVEQRWNAEFDGEDFPFIWNDARYDEIQDVVDLFGAAG